MDEKETKLVHRYRYFRWWWSRCFPKMKRQPTDIFDNQLCVAPASFQLSGWAHPNEQSQTPCRVPQVSAWASALDVLPTAFLPRTALPIAAVVAPWIFRPRSSGEWSSDRWRPLRKQDFSHGRRTSGSCPTDSTREAIGSHSSCLLFKLEPTCQLGLAVCGNASSADGFLCLAFDNPGFKNSLRYRSWDVFLWNIPSMLWKWKIRKIHLEIGQLSTLVTLCFFLWVFIRRCCLNPWSGAGAILITHQTSRVLQIFGGPRPQPSQSSFSFKSWEPNI